MRRIPLLAVLLAALLAPSARAELTEAPFAPVGSHTPCLRATGALGELALLGPQGRAGATDLWLAGVRGASRGPRIAMPLQARCADFASAPSGAAVLVVAAQRRAGAAALRLLVATREPGGAFGPLVEIARPAEQDLAVSAAVNARGDAVVVWQEAGTDSSTLVVAERIAVHVVRRAAGSGFGAVETLAAPYRVDSPALRRPLSAGIDAAGAATAAWVEGRAARVRTASAVPGAPFRPATTLPGRDSGEHLSLAVAADGRALLVGALAGRLAVFERAPGATAFAPVTLPGPALLGGPGVAPAIGLADSGAALVAWSEGADLGGGVQATWRAAPGAFAAPVVLDRGDTGSDSFGVSEPEIQVLGGVEPERPAAPSVALAPNGRGAVAWVGAGPGVAPPDVARVAIGDVTRGFVPERLGGRVRSVQLAVALLGADGAPGAAWIDADGAEPFGTRNGRLHVALPGAASGPEAAQPGFSIRVPAHAALYRGEPLPVRVHCDAACDVRVTARGSARTRTLQRAGTVRVAIGAPDDGFGTRAGRRIIVRATASAPGARRAATRRSATVVRRRRTLPLPRILDPGARRSGDRIVVTWRTAVPARRVTFYALPSRGRSSGAIGLVDVPGGGRTRHRVVLRRGPTIPRDVAGAGWVLLFSQSLDSGREAGPVRVRVR